MTENNTPNVVIQNPKTRRVINGVLSTLGGLLAIATAVDLASPHVDITAWTVPIFAGYAAACSVYGIAVIDPNTPKP